MSPNRAPANAPGHRGFVHHVVRGWCLGSGVGAIVMFWTGVVVGNGLLVLMGLAAAAVGSTVYRLETR